MVMQSLAIIYKEREMLWLWLDDSGSGSSFELQLRLNIGPDQIITRLKMGMKGCQALEEWCRIVLNTYSGVHISNMTSSWSDGKAFCALIHSHRPDLIDWEHVKKNSAAQ